MVLETPDVAEAADKIRDTVEEDEGAAEGARERRAANERFRRESAIAIGVLAMLLAIAGLGGGNATKEMLNANIQASDTYSFNQAKNIRQTSTALAAEELESLLLTQPTMPAETRATAAGERRHRASRRAATLPGSARARQRHAFWRGYGGSVPPPALRRQPIRHVRVRVRECRHARERGGGGGSPWRPR